MTPAGTHPTSTAVAPAGRALGIARGVRLEQAAGCAWFLLLALLYAKELPSPFHALPGAGAAIAAWAATLSHGCTVAFMITLAWLMVARTPAVARRPGLGPMLIALIGTYGVWLIGFLPPTHLSPAMTALSTVLTLLGNVLIVFSVLCLGRSFSILPHARGLVTRGPYAFVRHPLYAAEEIALIGVAMHVVWFAALPFVVAHLVLQLKRMTYEEQLLAEVFPPYRAYARRTARWIPGLW